MDRPELHVTPGYGELMHRSNYYAQVMRIGNRIEISGQGGWNDELEFPGSVRDEIVQAFDNVERVLNHVGSTWTDVVSVTSYHAPIGPESLELMVEQFRARMPERAPLWTCVGVAALGSPKMHVEIVVSAIVDAGG